MNNLRLSNDYINFMKYATKILDRPKVILELFSRSYLFLIEHGGVLQSFFTGLNERLTIQGNN